MDGAEITMLHSDSPETTAPPIARSLDNGTRDITSANEGWRRWAADFGTQCNTVACVNDSQSVWLAQIKMCCNLVAATQRRAECPDFRRNLKKE